VATTLGAFDWSTTRGVPAAGEVTLASDPLAGVSNTLRVSITDNDGNNRDAVIDLVATGDTIRISDDFATGAVGLPVDNVTYWAFPFTVSLGFVTADEPDAAEAVTLLSRVPGQWPDLEEFQLIVNMPEDDADWDASMQAYLNAAIATVKSNVGNWNESSDLPTENQGRAALQMALLLSSRNSVPGPALIRDSVYQALLTGQRRRWGIG
jgi:hypothetical protein